MPPETQFSCDITDSANILGFQKQISPQKTLQYKCFPQWIPNQVELAGCQSPQVHDICTHP